MTEMSGKVYMKKINRSGTATVAVLACAVFSVFAIPAADAAGFKAGYAKVDITPADGTPMAGYYDRRVSEGVIDRLNTRCLAVSDGERTALVYSVDNLGVRNDVVKDIRDAVSAATKVPCDHIYIASTHIHTGPWTTWKSAFRNKPEDKVPVMAANKILTDGCVAAAISAIRDLAPSKILIGRGKATDISFIRRFKMKDGSMRTNPPRNDPNVVAPAGSPDETLQLVRFVREGAKEIAVMNFQCHPDVVGGKKFSSDWPGLAAETLEAAFKGDIHAMLLNGAQGDTNHYRQKWRRGDYLPVRLDMARHMARTVAGAAMKTWDFCTPVPAGKVFAADCKVPVRVNKGKPEDFQLAEKWSELVKAGRRNEIPGEGMLGVTRAAWACRVIETRDWPDERELTVMVVTIGEAIAFGGFPGEPFTVLGSNVKSRSKFAMTIPTCTTNGYDGYFPDESAFTEGGYENATSRYVKGTGERLVDGMVAAMDEFWEKSRR